MKINTIKWTTYQNSLPLSGQPHFETKTPYGLRGGFDAFRPSPETHGSRKAILSLSFGAPKPLFRFQRFAAGFRNPHPRNRQFRTGIAGFSLSLPDGGRQPNRAVRAAEQTSFISIHAFCRKTKAAMGRRFILQTIAA